MKKGIIFAVTLGLSLSMVGCMGGTSQVRIEDPSDVEIIDEDDDFIGGEDDVDVDEDFDEDFDEDYDTDTELDLPNPAVENWLECIIGVWGEADVLDARTLTIKNDGTYELAYRGGGTQFGNIVLSEEETPDGNIHYWFTFNDVDGEIWESFAKEDNDYQQDLYSGQDGAIHFIRLDEESLNTESVYEKFVGTWVNDRCTITIEELPNEALVTIIWGNSAASSYKWEYFCHYINMDDLLECYTGTKALLWDDTKENAAAGLEFEKMPY